MTSPLYYYVSCDATSFEKLTNCVGRLHLETLKPQSHHTA